MPQPLNIAVISNNPSPHSNILCCLSAAILSETTSGHWPTYIPLSFKSVEPALAKNVLKDKFLFWPQALSPRHMNAHRIYAWLAIDSQGVDLAQELIKDAGSVPTNDKWYGGEFYREYFKEKIMLCDLSKIQFDLESTPQNTIRELKAALAPWREKFYEAFCASS